MNNTPPGLRLVCGLDFLCCRLSVWLHECLQREVCPTCHRPPLVRCVSVTDTDTAGTVLTVWRL